MKKVKGKKVMILLLVVILIIGTIVLIKLGGKHGSTEDAGTEQTVAMKEPEGKVLDLTAEQLKELAEATKDVEAPTVETETEEEAETEEVDPNAVNKGNTVEITVYAQDAEENQEYNCGTLKVTAEQLTELKKAASSTTSEIKGVMTVDSMNFIKDKNLQYIQVKSVQTKYSNTSDGVTIENSQVKFNCPALAAFIQLGGYSAEEALTATEVTLPINYSYEDGKLKIQAVVTDDKGVVRMYNMADYELSSEAFDGSDVKVTLAVEETDDGKNHQFVAKDYVNNVPTGGDIEAYYLKNGSFEVRYYEEADDTTYAEDEFDRIGKYEIYYPKELDNSTDTKKYPVIVMVNGTGACASKYKESFKHFASWGFIVIGNESEWTARGGSADKTLEYLLTLNEDKDSIFYQKADTDNIGIVGHSQGGTGTMNAATIQSHASMYKAVVGLSVASSEVKDPYWGFDETKIQAPTLLLASTGTTDSALAPLEGVTYLYNHIPDSVTKFMARRNDVDHGGMLYSADGYVTAWFMWNLKGDEKAAGAFTGDDAEIYQNKYYQDQKTNLEHSESNPAESKGNLTLNTSDSTVGIPALNFVDSGFTFANEAINAAYSMDQNNKLTIESTTEKFFSAELEAFWKALGLSEVDAKAAATLEMNVTYEVTMNVDRSASVQITAAGHVGDSDKQLDLGT
jgi:flagellar basal body-associated protein FliL/pimeloyl-ACP methyl ester carboxylesterase